MKHQETSTKRITHFDDMPDELLLLICCYLTPVHILKAFLDYNDRLFRCIFDYRTNLDLTKSSYADYQYIVKELRHWPRFRPSTLTVANTMIPSQIELFMDTCVSVMSYCTHVYRLQLLECTEQCITGINIYIEYFYNLHSLRITESVSRSRSSKIDYSKIEKLRNLIFDGKFRPLTELELTTMEGIILDKQLRPNECLKQLTVSLRTVDDLFVLLNGLVPNLCTLTVILCNSRIRTRSPLPPLWPCQTMSHMNQFRLTTNDQINFCFDLLRHIVAPLTQLDSFTLDVRGSTSDARLTQGNQIEMLLDEFMPRLRHFCYYVKTNCQIDMQVTFTEIDSTSDHVSFFSESFAQLTKRWPMAYQVTPDRRNTHVYTVPWPLEQCSLSMLANDDTTSVCLNVVSLTIDMPCHGMNLSHRFPNVHILTALSTYKLDLGGFRRLRHLVTNSMKLVSRLTRRIDTLTLINENDVYFKSIVCSNVRHLTIPNFYVDCVETITSLMQCFPNLHSLNIRFQMNTTMFRDSLDMLFDAQKLPNLTLLYTNWSATNFYDYTSIKIWIADNTELKSRSIPFHGHCDGKYLTVWL